MTEGEKTVLVIMRGLCIGNNVGGAEKFGADIAILLNKYPSLAVKVFVIQGFDTQVEREWKEKLIQGGIDVSMEHYLDPTKLQNYFKILNNLKNFVEILEPDFRN